jgi:hypothetical protein
MLFGTTPYLGLNSLLIMDACELIPIEHDKEFEELCCEVARDVFGDFSAHLYGRNGQDQGGIDIQSVNLKHEPAQKVVIQCKFYDPRKTHQGRVCSELEKDFCSAIEAEKNERFSFDVFVFAISLERDTRLNDKASSLENQYDKGVVVWCWDDLRNSVSAHPRLQRLFARGVNGSGVRFLGKNFIESLTSRELDPLRFFTARHSDDCQWLGVAQGLAAQRSCQEQIESVLKAQFLSHQTDRKVVAVICGEGGSGKSTVLRQIALNQAKDRAVWWIENVSNFLQYDAISISENIHLSCLLIIEDWYRNMKGLSCSDFFQWLSEQSNVLVLIGDRTYQQTVYGDYCRSGAKYQLLPSDNQIILEYIQSTYSEYRRIFDQFNDHLFHQNSLFILLFIAATLLTEESQNSSSIDLSDGPLTSFQKIIAKKLLSLERDQHHQGLGKALILLGQIYTSSKLQYQPLSESFFLHAASFLGNNPKVFDVVDSVGYPHDVLALAYKNTVVSKHMGGSFDRLEFNHDVLADQGVIHAHDYYPDLDISGKYALITLLESLSDSVVEPDGVLMLWIWLFQKEVFSNIEKARTSLFRILQKAPTRIGIVSFRSLLTALSEDLTMRQEVGEFVVDQPDFAKTMHVSVVIAALSVVSKQRRLQVANSICDIPDVLGHYHEEIILYAVSYSAHAKANSLLQTIFANPGEPLRLPSRILIAAFKRLSDSQQVDVADQIFSNPVSDTPVVFRILALKKASKSTITALSSRILTALGAIDDFYPSLITALIECSEKQSAISLSTKILQTSSFYTQYPDHLVQAALRLAPAFISSSASRQILSLTNFYKDLPVNIVLEALNRADPNVREIAVDQILANPQEYKSLSSQLLGKALSLSSNSRKVADDILRLPNFYKTLPSDFVIIAMTLATAQISMNSADAILANMVDFSDVPPEVIVKALGLASTSRSVAASELVFHHLQTGTKLSEHLIAKAFEVVPDSKKKSKDILSRDGFYPFFPKIAVLKAFKLAEASVAQAAANRVLSDLHDLSDLHYLLNLPEELVFAVLRAAEDLQAVHASGLILSQVMSMLPQVTLPVPIIVNAMKYADNSFSAQLSERFLSYPDALTYYPEELIERSLIDGPPGETVFRVARTVINECRCRGRIIFYALKALMASSCKDDGLRVAALVDDVNHSVAQKRPGYKDHLKLFHLLIQLPVFESETQRARFSFDMRNYKPGYDVAKKANLATIMKFISDSPGFTELDDSYHSLCKKVLSNSLEDLRTQVHSGKPLEVRHIIYALGYPALRREACEVVENLLTFVCGSDSTLNGSEFHHQLVQLSSQLPVEANSQHFRKGSAWGSMNLQRLESLRKALDP